MHLTVSSGWYPSRHIGQAVLSDPEMLWPSFSTTNSVQDLILESLRPTGTVLVVCGGTMPGNMLACGGAPVSKSSYFFLTKLHNCMQVARQQNVEIITIPGILMASVRIFDSLLCDSSVHVDSMNLKFTGTTTR
ncbi:unnamed protein product [Fraxinus pennsylvanica]|uniref:Uncharacterized protein n=1 Tax=Fraxinus pennsylvanica TaxID=56036 RepID=A0AAD2EBD7_9LAMI|nr:unnamed protein product [Fraxinus pennsylvanica]